MRRTAALAVVLTALLAAGCQTRNANPVRISQAGDGALDCEMIREIQLENRQVAAKLVKLNEGVAIGNAIAVAINKVWFWPGIFGVDLSDAEEIEARALFDRNRRLEELASAKNCPEPSGGPSPDSVPTPQINAQAKAS